MNDTSGTGSGPIPDWADPRLVVGLRGEDGDFVIDGNPHTHRGLIRMFSPDEPHSFVSFSVRPDQIVPRTELAAGWIQGFLSGNEPPGEWTDDYLPERRDRTLDFFHEHHYPLSSQRRGRVAFNAVRSSVECGGGSTPLERLARVCSAVAERVGEWDAAGWIAVDPDYGPLDPVPLETPAQIFEALARVNRPGTLRRYPEIIVLNPEPGTRRIEIRIAINGEPDSVDAGFRVTINLEDLAPFGLQRDLDDHAPWMRSTFRTLVECSAPDVASLSFGTPLRESTGFRVPSDWDVDAIGIPGWLTFLAGASAETDRVGTEVRPFGDDEFDRSVLVDGSLYEFRGAPSEFTTEAADRLAAHLDATDD